MGLRDDKKRDSRRRMLEAARALFERKGIDEVAVHEIADAARVSLKTFYNYFRNRDAVFDEIALDLVVAAADRLEAALDDEASARQAIEQGALALGRSLSRAPELTAAIFQRSALFRAEGELRETELRMYEALAALIRRDQQSGALRDDIDPLALAEILVASWMLISLNWLAGWWKSRGSLQERLRTATRVVFDGADR